MLHDLSLTFLGDSLRGDSLTHSKSVNILAQIIWGPPVKPIHLHWLLPDWWTVREYERFAYRWKSYGDSCDSLEDYALAWLAAQLEVLLDEDHDARKGRQWKQLRSRMEQLAKEAPKREARQMLRSSALIGIALLLAPESAISVKIAERLITETPIFKKALQEEDLVHRIRSWRALNVGKILKQTQQRQQGEVPNSQWVALFAALAPQPAVQWFRNSLARDLPAPPAGPRSAISDVNRSLQNNASDGKLLEAIRKSREELHHYQSQRPYLASLLSHAELILKRPYESHPINKLGEGILVPTQDDIDQTQDRPRP